MSTVELEDGSKGFFNSNPENIPTLRLLHNAYSKKVFDFSLFFDTNDYFRIAGLYSSFYYNPNRNIKNKKSYLDRASQIYDIDESQYSESLIRTSRDMYPLSASFIFFIFCIYGVFFY